MGNEIEVRGNIPLEKKTAPQPYTEMNVYYYGNDCVLDSRETGYDMTELESDIIAGIKGCYKKHLDKEAQEQQQRFEDSFVMVKRKRQEEYMDYILTYEKERQERIKRSEARQNRKGREKPTAFDLFEFISALVLIAVALIAWW